jgi:hypothetical protein|tara:strand:- start:369 stop:1130 length:762 start_codon:yes stop_codon:yes gene_type:complete
MALTRIGTSAYSTLDATKLTGNLPAISGASLTSLTAGNLTGSLPAISGANLTGVSSTWTKISKTTVTSASPSGTVEITGITGYKRYWISGNNISVNGVSGNNHLKWQFGGSDGTYYTSSSNAQEFYVDHNNGENMNYKDSSSQNIQTSNASYMQKSEFAGSGSANERNGCRLNFNLYFGPVHLNGNSPDTGSGLKCAWGEAMWNRNGDTHHYARHVGGYLEYNLAIDRIRFLFHSGNSVNAGQFILYGQTDSA